MKKLLVLTAFIFGGYLAGHGQSAPAQKVEAATPVAVTPEAEKKTEKQAEKETDKKELKACCKKGAAEGKACCKKDSKDKSCNKDDKKACCKNKGKEEKHEGEE